MSISYDKTGRTRQKARTREALLAAARTLLASGRTPAVEEAAAEADISRATAYRYFPNQRALLSAAHPEIRRDSLLGSSPPDEVEARLTTVLAEFLRITVETEAQLRAMLRLSLDDDPGIRSDLPLRKGRAIAWIEEALEPLREVISQESFAQLVLAIRSSAGIEPLIWLTDVGGLDRAEAVEVMMSTGRALLAQAIRETSPQA